MDIAPLRAHGIEAAARKLRHAAFARQACDFVALAHHADDQAETLLLQLLRGAGVRGASAMPVLSLSKRPVRACRSGRCQPNEYQPNLLRPLLHCSRQEILDYAAAHQLQWIEDESNADDSYPRNFLRHRVLPLLEKKFPAYRDTLARSAQHFAEASSLLDELARQDAAKAIHAGDACRYRFADIKPAPCKKPAALFSALYRRTDAANRATGRYVAATLLRAENAAVCIAYGGWQVRRYHGSVHALRAFGEFDRNRILSWHGEAELDWPALNIRLHFNYIQDAGISLAKLQRAPVTIRLRQGGEALRPHPNAATRTLKNLLQEHHVPPWRRDRLPLLYCGDDLVCVLGLAIAAEYQAAAGEAGIQLLAE